MGRCGIRLHYPVFAAVIADSGACVNASKIGHAESLAHAAALAEKAGYWIRETDDGGGNRLLTQADGTLTGFWITVYPRDNPADPVA